MDTQNSTYEREQLGIHLLGVATALGAGYLYLVRPRSSSSMMWGLGGVAAVSHVSVYTQTRDSKAIRRVALYATALFGAALLGRRVADLSVQLKRVQAAFNGSEFRLLERALLDVSWIVGVAGLAGWKWAHVARKDLAWAHEGVETGTNRAPWTTLGRVFNPTLRDTQRTFIGFGRRAVDGYSFGRGSNALGLKENAYENWVLDALTENWACLTQEEREQFIEGLWDGSWHLSFGFTFQAFREAGLLEDLKQLLKVRDRVDSSQIDKTLKEVFQKLPFKEFEAAIARIEEQRQHTETPTIDDDRRWAKELRPIFIFHQVVSNPKIKSFQQQNEVDEVMEEGGQLPWLVDRSTWFQGTHSRFVKLIDGVLTAARNRDPTFNSYWMSLEPALPQANSPQVANLSQDEEGVEAALLKLYGEINPAKDQEWSDLLRAINTSQEGINGRFVEMGLVSEEAWQGQVLEGLPTDSSRKKALIAKLGALSKQHPCVTPVEPVEVVTATASSVDTEPPSRAMELLGKGVKHIGNLTLMALSIGLIYAYRKERMIAHPTASVLGISYGSFAGIERLQKHRKAIHEGRQVSEPDNPFNLFTEDARFNIMVLKITWPLSVAIGRALGPVGTFVGVGVLVQDALAFSAIKGEECYRAWRP